MTWPLVKFVDAPEVGANVRYDFNNALAAATRSVQSDFTLGSPTLDGEPDAIGVAYGYRQPLFTQLVKGEKSDALQALSLLSRELLRPTNWLMFQLDAVSGPIWLKVYRSQFAALSLERVYVDLPSGDTAPLSDTWAIPVPLVADAFAYGQRVTLDPVMVTQSPDGDNPMRIELPAIKGDAPTPLRVQITPEAGLDASLDNEWMIGCIAGSADAEDPVVSIGTGDGFTPSSGGAVTTGDAQFFGGDYRTFFTTTTVKSLTGYLPVTTRGRYKILVRGEFTENTIFGLFISLGYAENIKVVGDQGFSNYHGWVDLGEVTLPPGVNLPDDQPITIEPQFFFLTMRDSVLSGTVKLDALKVIPVGGPTVDQATILKAKGPDNSTLAVDVLEGGTTNTFDGDSESFWGSTVALGVIGTAPKLTGGFPVADPASEQNLLLVMAMHRGTIVGSAPYITTPDTEAEVTVSYHPRLLHLGDGT
jgi:hypothetical protein